MWIEWLELEAVRMYRRSTRIAFGSGLNLVHAPNESGKSTLAVSLRTLLAYPASSSSQEVVSLRPWSGGVSAMEARLHVGRRTVQLRKLFATNNAASLLRVDGEPDVTVNSDVQKKLRALLGLDDGTNQMLGLNALELAWVRQGQRALDYSGVAASAWGGISSELQRATQEFATPAHVRALEEALAEVYSEYFTNGGKLAKKNESPYVRAKAASDEAHAILSALRTRQKAHRDALETLGRARAEESRQEALAVEARNDVKALERHLADRLARGAELDRTRGDLAIPQARLELVSQWLEERKTTESRMFQLEENAKRRAGTLETLVAEAAHTKSEHNAARGRADVQRHVRMTARDEAVLVERRVQWIESEIVRAHAAQALAAFDGLTKRRSEAEASLQQNPVTVTEFEAVRGLDEAVRTNAAVLDALMARIEVRALANLALSHTGESFAISAGAQRVFTTDRPLTLRVGDVAEVTITPGSAGELDERRASLAASRTQFAARLAALRVPDLASARERAQAHETLDRTVKELNSEIRRLAPMGRGPLVKELDDARRAEERARALLPPDAALPEVNAIDAFRQELTRVRGLATTAEHQLDAVCQEVERAELAARQSAQALENHRNAAQQEETEQAILLIRLETSRSTHGEREALEAEAASLVEVCGPLAHAVRQLEQLLSNLPAKDVIEQRLGMARATQATVEDALAKARATAAERRGTLRTHEPVSDEALENAEDVAQEKARALEDADRDVKALQLLRERWLAAKQAAVASLQAPVEKAFGGFVQTVFGPGATARLTSQDTAFVPTHLVRDGNVCEAGRLSFGAAEQLDILFRLAVAKAIASTRPLPILLDDPFGYTDPDRRAAMWEVLRGVSQDLQVLLFTCDPARFAGFAMDGVHVIDLAQV